MKKNRNPISLIIIFILLSSTIGCHSISNDVRVHNKYELKETKSWQIEFAYFHGEQEKKESEAGLSENTVTKYGENPRDWQFIDDIIFYLRGDYKIDVQKQQNKPSGFIRVNLINWNWDEDYYRSSNISIYSNNGELIAQIKVQNGDRIATVLNDSEFAQYVAEQLFTILK